MKKILLFTLLSLLVLSIAGTSLAFFPRGMGMKAKIFGMTHEEMQTEFSSGKNFMDLMEEHSITKEDMRIRMHEMKTDYLQELVDEGKITEEEMQEKLEWWLNKTKDHKRGFGCQKRPTIE